MENQKIKIGLAEDQLLFRKGLTAMLNDQSAFDVAIETSNGEELINRIKETGVVPDIVLLDLRMPVLNGIDTTKILKKEYPDLPVLILSAHNEERFIVHMVELGVNGYLDKNSEPEEVIRAIETIVKAGFYFNDSTIHAMRSGLSGGKAKVSLTDPAGLTNREQEVLQLICMEHTAPEIAEKLFLSVRTVEGHRNNLLLKTGARNIAGLVMYAVRNGLTGENF